MSKNKKGGRPTKKINEVRKHRIAFYLSDDELKRYNKLKLGVIRYSPTLSMSDFFRMVIDNFDDTLIPYLLESSNSEVKQFMNKKSLHTKIFSDYNE